MESSARSSEDDHGARRKQLEDSEAKLRKALPLWHRWEAEYEGLKEEIATLPSNATSEDFLKLSQDYENEVLDKKEIDELLGLDKGVLRTPDQVSRLLDRRIEYVQRNASSVVKQLDDVENKIEQVDFVEKPHRTGEEDLPIAEIEEELDDDENVISSRITSPDEDKAQLKGVLEKMGVDLHRVKDTESQTRASEGLSAESDTGVRDARPVTHATPQSEEAINGISRSSSSLKTVSDSDQKPARRERQKSVSFAEGTKDEAPAAPVLKRQHLPFGSTLDPDAQSNLESIMPGTFKNTDRVLELDDDDNIVAASVPQIPENESPEDARMRRDMLQYSLSEVGAVVAELDIEEATTESDEDFTTDSEEDEDERGMSRSSVMSEDYRQEMLNLENRLQARATVNAGPPKTAEEEDLVNSHSNENAMDIDSCLRQRAETSSTTKSVRFDDSINETSNSSSPVGKAPDLEDSALSADAGPAVSDVISERKSPAQPPQLQSKEKPSRFKTDRAKHTPSSETNASSENSSVKVSRFKASRKAK